MSMLHIRHALEIALVCKDTWDGSGLTSVWGRLDSWCMASALALASSSIVHLSHLTAAVAARASPTRAFACLPALATTDSSAPCAHRIPTVLPDLRAASERPRPPLPTPRSVQQYLTPVALRRAYAHHCRLPSLVVLPSPTTQHVRTVRRAASRHNGLPGHIPCHLRLRAPERQ